VASRAEFRARVATRDNRLLNGLRRRLGHAAVLGGLPSVERVAYSDEVFQLLFELQPLARKDAFAIIARVSATAERQPPPQRPPSPDERVKVRWTEPFTERFLSEAPRAKDDIDLTRRLGLPSYCRGAMRAARSRYARRGLLGAPRDSRPVGDPLPLAA
jgi:hypothetical protein